MRIRRVVGLGAVALVLIAAGAVWWIGGLYGFFDIYRHGGTFWLPVAIDSPRLSPSMRLALAKSPPATSGALTWKTVADGFEAGELPVIAEGHEVDRIMLARIDPAKFRLTARTAPLGNRGLDEWVEAIHPALVVNGSYYAFDGRPDTPLKSDGVLLGPSDYDAKAGAFVASDSFTGIRDLGNGDWKSVFKDARDAMVSYPLLVRDGASGVKVASNWLANRSFVGQDGTGRIVIGTTKDAFFSLGRLADFLLAAPLDLKIALNLDGGPVASQAIDLAGFERRTYGIWELQVTGDRGSLLTFPFGTTAMPVVLAVFPK